MNLGSNTHENYPGLRYLMHKTTHYGGHHIIAYLAFKLKESPYPVIV